jgi:aerobic-type carbon monoxide dehydrogenase small subunit (CoxS/CutS family)
VSERPSSLPAGTTAVPAGDRRRIAVTINGERRVADVAPRTLLADFLREDLGLAGCHTGCEQGHCGACTVRVDGQPVRACLMLAIQVDERSLETIEGLLDRPTYRRLCDAFRAAGALQCGFCTPGMLITAEAVLSAAPGLSDPELRIALAGNLCRCTGYEPIVTALRAASARPHESADGRVGDRGEASTV